MNIFYLSDCPKKSAQYLYNKHVVKMILETAQLLCTAHHELDSKIKVPYKPAYKNHPSSVWVRSSAENYWWTYQHFIHLGNEYKKRYSKVHLSISKCSEALYNIPKNIPVTAFYQPPQCMPDEYHCDDSIEAYWKYYIQGKKHICSSNEKPYLTKPNN